MHTAAVCRRCRCCRHLFLLLLRALVPRARKDLSRRAHKLVLVTQSRNKMFKRGHAEAIWKLNVGLNERILSIKYPFADEVPARAQQTRGSVRGKI